MADEGKATDEAEIRRLIDEWVRAFRAKDIKGVMSVFATDVVSYDIVPPLRYVGAAAYRKPWEEAFASYQTPVGYEVRDPSITIGEDVAFSHSLNRVSGTLTDGVRTELWLRWTIGLRKIDGEWLVTHEHASVPVDLMTGRAALDLEP